MREELEQNFGWMVRVWSDIMHAGVNGKHGPRKDTRTWGSRPSPDSIGSGFSVPPEAA